MFLMCKCAYVQMSKKRLPKKMHNSQKSCSHLKVLQHTCNIPTPFCTYAHLHIVYTATF